VKGSRRLGPAVVALCLTAGFVVIAVLVELGDDSVETRIMTGLHDRVGDSGDGFLAAVDGLTNLPCLAVVAAVAVVWLLVADRRHDAFLFVVTVAGVWLFNPLLKELFARPRPHLWPSTVDVSPYAFPSGHAANTAALVLAVVLALPAGRWRVVAGVVGGAVLLVVAYSQLALGLHYPTDLLAGWLWAAACVAWVRVVRGRATSP
jgi:membrane-associated phospholipid phosphatase